MAEPTAPATYVPEVGPPLLASEMLAAVLRVPQMESNTGAALLVVQSKDPERACRGGGPVTKRYEQPPHIRPRHRMVTSRNSTDDPCDMPALVPNVLFRADDLTHNGPRGRGGRQGWSNLPRTAAPRMRSPAMEQGETETEWGGLVRRHPTLHPSLPPFLLVLPSGDDFLPATSATRSSTARAFRVRA